MLREISFGLLCMAACYATNSYSMEHSIQQYQGVTIDYALQPNQPQLFTNYMFWPIEANCVVYSNDDNNTLYALGRSKKARVNNVAIVSGQSLQLVIHPNENLRINADSGAKVEITNLGVSTIMASCTS